MIDLAIIPARGGSVGIPGKNIKPLGGRPLIDWTITAARASGRFKRVIVSTDDEEIAAVARQCGAEVPFMRPAELATGEARSADVVKHALGLLGSVETFGLFQPTSPFRSARHLKEATHRFLASLAPSLVSVTPSKPLEWSFHLGQDLRLIPAAPEKWADRRQDALRVFVPNGAIYLCRRSAFDIKRSVYFDETIGYEMDRLDSLDIDDPEDLELARAIVDRGLRVIDQ